MHISLGVHFINIKAINLYKKQGWKQDGRSSNKTTVFCTLCFLTYCDERT